MKEGINARLGTFSRGTPRRGNDHPAWPAEHGICAASCRDARQMRAIPYIPANRFCDNGPDLRPHGRAGMAAIFYDEIFHNALTPLHSAGRYRVFIDILRIK